MKNKLKKKVPRFGVRSLRKVTRSAKKAARKTTEQASVGWKSISDQVVGVKEHEIQQPEAPRITTDTVAEHREAVLSQARRFIHPLHTPRRIVTVSLSIILGLAASVILSAGVLLYKFDSTNSFVYSVSRFVPFPVARVDGDFVRFSEYLFTLRSQVHYLRDFAQEGVDIDSEEGRDLLANTKKRVLTQVQAQAQAAKLAAQAGIHVTKDEIDEEIHLINVQAGIDQSDGTTENVIDKFFDWDMDDYRKDTKRQLTERKLLPIYDKTSQKQLKVVQSKLKAGKSFSAVAKTYSQDPNTKGEGGKLGVIARTEPGLRKIALETIFSLKTRQVSAPITTPDGYYIYRVDKKVSKNSYEVSQIFISFMDLDKFLSEQLKLVTHKAYIKVN